MNSQPEPQCGIILVTASSKEEAEAIAKILIHEKLAACVSMVPVHSIYTWQNEIHSGEEWQLLIKTVLLQFPLLEARVREIHSYEMPEIVALPIIQGSLAYLKWIGEQVQR